LPRAFFRGTATFFRTVVALLTAFFFAEAFRGDIFLASFFFACFLLGAAFFGFDFFFLRLLLVAIGAVYHRRVMPDFRRFRDYLISVQGCAWFRAYFATAFSSKSKPKPGV